VVLAADDVIEKLYDVSGLRARSHQPEAIGSNPGGDRRESLIPTKPRTGYT
jgi:hypothetical protein